MKCRMWCEVYQIQIGQIICIFLIYKNFRKIIFVGFRRQMQILDTGILNASAGERNKTKSSSFNRHSIDK